MKRNTHPIERALRVVAGLILLSLAFWGPSNRWFLLSIIPLATGFIGWCPLYTVLGINTCKTDKSSTTKLKILNKENL
jgi:hypothetical protein